MRGSDSGRPVAAPFFLSCCSTNDHRQNSLTLNLSRTTCLCVQHRLSPALSRLGRAARAFVSALVLSFNSQHPFTSIPIMTVAAVVNTGADLPLFFRPVSLLLIAVHLLVLQLALGIDPRQLPPPVPAMLACSFFSYLLHALRPHLLTHPGQARGAASLHVVLYFGVLLPVTLCGGEGGFEHAKDWQMVAACLLVLSAIITFSFVVIPCELSLSLSLSLSPVSLSLIPPRRRRMRLEGERDGRAI